MMSTGGGAPIVGAKVVSSDDVELGEVKEVIGDCFKIDAPMARDYWLGVDTIQDTQGGIVHLVVTNLALDAVKQEEPSGGHTGMHRHN
jgi:hypothetical protein